MFYLAHVLPHFAKKAQHLVAVSGATKADMVKFWKCREDAVTVLYNGLPGGARTTNHEPRTTSHEPRTTNHEPRTANHEPRTTILYISRIEHPGKNHVRLIDAYSRLPREVAAAHPLVLAGADWRTPRPSTRRRRLRRMPT